MPNNAANGAVRSTLVRAIADKLHAAGRHGIVIEERSQLLQLGLIDSEDLIEIILEVEQLCGCEFNPERMDLDAGLTLAGLLSAFIPPRG